MGMLQLQPGYKEYLWGGTRLLKEFHLPYAGKSLAEAWVLSSHPDGPSIIANGPYKGQTLIKYFQQEGKAVWGSRCQRFENFPVLIKLIDARDDLSLQVHPDDAYALKNEHQYGKSEMWHILACEPGAFIYYGFKRQVTSQEVRERLQNQTLTEVLQKVLVQPGETYFIQAGLVHAIGRGCLLAEIQQNSNVTYRMYDYDRKDAQGHLRELHIDKALAVAQLGPAPVRPATDGHLGSCSYFTVDKVHLYATPAGVWTGMVTPDAFVSLLFVEGAGKVECGGETFAYQRGSSFFLPAGSGSFTIKGRGSVLLTTLDA